MRLLSMAESKITSQNVISASLSIAAHCVWLGNSLI